MFIIDLPRLLKGQRTTPSKLTPFGRELRNFLKAMEIESSVIDSMLDFDFSKSAHLAFVHSM
jgi:Tyrosyl-DNA phosphodiesterase